MIIINPKPQKRMKKVIMITLLAMLFGQFVMAQSAKDTTKYIMENGLIKTVHQTTISTWKNPDQAKFTPEELNKLSTGGNVFTICNETKVPLTILPVKVRGMAIGKSYRIDAGGSIKLIRSAQLITTSVETNWYMTFLWIIIPFVLAVFLGLLIRDTKSLGFYYLISVAIGIFFSATPWLAKSVGYFDPISGLQLFGVAICLIYLSWKASYGLSFLTRLFGILYAISITGLTYHVSNSLYFGQGLGITFQCLIFYGTLISVSLLISYFTHRTTKRIYSK